MIDIEEAESTAADLFGAFITPEARHDPYPAYAALRQTTPVLDSGVGFWLLSNLADVRAVLRDPTCSADETKSTFNQMLAAENVAADAYVNPIDTMGMLFFMDPPDHTRLRGLVARSFTPRRVAMIRPRVDELVSSLLAAKDPGDEFDVIGDLAYPLATQVICELLGVPTHDRVRFGQWSSDVSHSIDPSAIRSEEANIAIERSADELLAYFDELIVDRRKNPGDDLLSSLIEAEDDGDRLSHDELLAMGLLLLIAGHETTVNLIGNGVLALLAQPDSIEELRSRPDLDETAVDEFLRFDAPVQLTQRVAMNDLDISGTTIPAGASMILLLGAANRDPAAFADPDMLRLDRQDNAHVAFGGGIHHCLGAALARIEGQIAISELVRSSSRLELAEEPVRRPTFTLRGLERLVVTR